MGLEWGPRDRSSVMGGSRVGERCCSTAEPSIIDRKHWLILVLRRRICTCQLQAMSMQVVLSGNPFCCSAHEYGSALASPVTVRFAIGDRRNDARRKIALPPAGHNSPRSEQADAVLSGDMLRGLRE